MNVMRSCPASDWSTLVLQYDEACFCVDFLRKILKSAGNVMNPETSNSLDVLLAQAQGLMRRGCAAVAATAELRRSAHSNLTGHSFYASSPESAEH